jgi:CheY-like chemotaxis protein
MQQHTGDREELQVECQICGGPSSSSAVSQAARALAKRILIVDDDVANRALLEALVASMGYDYRSASDGLEALNCLDAEIDVVLLDIVMPGLDGYEVARRIRSGTSCQDVPIIMVSGLNCGEDRRKAQQAGANLFVSKPIDRLELGSSLRTLLNHTVEKSAW